MTRTLGNCWVNKVVHFVCLLLGNFPTSEFYIPTFRNTLFNLRRQVGMKNSSYLPTYEDGTECSEKSAYTFQTPGNYLGESIQHSERGKSLKSRKVVRPYYVG